MIRKALIVIGMIAMSVGTVTTVGVATSGVAGAVTPPAPTTINCAVTGGGTFVSPGVSAGGALTNKTSVKSVDTTTASGTNCPNAPVNVSVVSATTACPQTGGVPNAGDPAVCLASTTSKGVTTYAIAKYPYYFNTSVGYILTGLGDLQAGLQAKAIKATIDSMGVVLAVGAVNQVVPNAACGSYAGFDITGDVTVKGATIGTYSQLECIINDAGTGTTGNLATDILSPTAVITGITIGGPNSVLSVVIPTTSCAVAGSVTFPAPGLSASGAITNKLTENTVSSTGTTGTGCPTTTSATKIVSTTTACPQTAGVPNSGDPAACLASTVSKGVTIYAIAKDPNYYDTTGSFLGTGLADLTTALQAKPTKATVNGVGLSLVFGSATQVLPGGVCGSAVGFNITGNGQVKGTNVATYDEIVCLSGDAGTGTTGNVFNDLLSPTAIVTSATIGGASSLTVTF